MSRCCTNLMQLGVALVVCRDQHRGRYPRLDRLLTELNRSGVITLSSLFGCPGLPIRYTRSGGDDPGRWSGTGRATTRFAQRSYRPQQGTRQSARCWLQIASKRRFVREISFLRLLRKLNQK